MVETILLPSLPFRNPNIPPETTHLPLHPITLWPVGAIDNVWVIPGGLDRDKLISALGKITGIWPNIAGRYEKKERAGIPGEWDFSIHLTNSPLPVTFVSLDKTQVFPDARVIQPTLEPYITKLPPTFAIPNSDSPLLTIQITTLPTSTIIGISWGHILGDGATFHQFTQHLAALYSHPNEDISLESYPSFFPHISLPRNPTKELFERYDISHIMPVEITGPEGMIERYTKSAKESTMMTIRITSVEMKLLKERIQCGTQTKLSDQDCISAWWISLLTRSGNPIQRVVNSVNYRHLAGSHPSFPKNLPTLAANVAQMIATDLTPYSSDPSWLSSTAEAIRATLISIRTDLETTCDWLSVCAPRLEESAIQGKAQVMVPLENECIVNSNLRYDWNVTFDTSLTKFHTRASIIRFLRVFQANDGEAIELTWNVKPGEQLGIEQMVEEDKQSWGTSTFSNT